MRDVLHRRLTMLAILSLSLSNYATGSAVSPALASFSAFWPEAPSLAIKMLASLPALAIIPTSLVAGRLAARLSNRRMAITGLALYLLGGVGAFFTTSLWLVLAFRLLLGVGAGIVIPLSVGLIGTHYTGEARVRMTGYSTGMASLGATVLTLLAGLLGEFGPRHVFLLYAVMLPVFVLTVAFVRDAERAPRPAGLRARFNPDVAKVALYMFIVTTLLFAMYLYVAPHMADLGLGGPAQAGLVLVVPNISGVVMGYLFCHVRRICRWQTGPLGLAFMAASFALMGWAQTLPVLVLAVMLNGMGTGVINPLNYLRIVNAVEPHEYAFTVAIANSFLYLGQFASAVFYEAMLGWGVLSGIGELFYANAVFCALAALAYGVRRHRRGRVC